MYARIITSEQKYTIEDAKRIIETERQAKRELFLYKAKQKLLGVVSIGISIASPLLLEDVTASIIMLPLGLYLLFTKEKVVY